jgi:ketosteroid isomerase-like protein
MPSDSATPIIERFITGLETQDRELLRSITTEDVVWSLPGTNLMAGELPGVDGMLKRARILKRFGVTLEVLHLLTGRTGVAVMLHNTGTHNGKALDEYLTTVGQLREGRLSRLDTYISDIPMLDSYFT